MKYSGLIHILRRDIVKKLRFKKKDLARIHKVQVKEIPK